MSIPIVYIQRYAVGIELYSRSLKKVYYVDLQLITFVFVCVFLQFFVPLQYKTCRVLS